MANEQLLVWILIATFVVCYPDDSWILARLVSLKVQVHCLNAVLFVKAYSAYWQISRMMDKVGMAPPPFRFIPIWERDQP